MELHPETPVRGVRLADLFPGYHRGERQEYMRDFAAGFGIEGMASPERLPNTRRILAMAEYAREMGKLDTFRTLAMKERWENGSDLEDVNILGNLAAASGLDRQKALKASESAVYLVRIDDIRAEAERMGINGIPTFIIGKERIVGCQPYQVVAEAVIRVGGQRRS